VGCQLYDTKLAVGDSRGMSGTAEQVVIDARLVKRFPAHQDTAAFELNVHLRAGAGITTLFGSSGAGKTLTLNCLAGFARPDEGRILVRDAIYFDAATGFHLPPQLRRCGYIFQDHALFPHMTVRENLRFAASAARRDKKPLVHRYRRVNELLETFELAELAGRTPAQLSGGQRQRAALARVLVGEPRVLLLDEPTRGLDARLREAFYEVLHKTRSQLEIPVVLVTHDLEECFELADFVYLMNHGQVLQSGSRESVFAKPASIEVARMLGKYNVVAARIAGLDPGRNTSRLSVLGGMVEGQYLPGHLIGDTGWLCVREQDVRVSASKPAGQEDAISTQVRKATSTAMGWRIEFDDDLCVIVSESDWQELRGSATLWVTIPRSAVHFIG
jgi:molybdate transport system ATP-binding protein